MSEPQSELCSSYRTLYEFLPFFIIRMFLFTLKSGLKRFGWTGERYCVVCCLNLFHGTAQVPCQVLINKRGECYEKHNKTKPKKVKIYSSVTSKLLRLRGKTFEKETDFLYKNEVQRNFDFEGYFRSLSTF